MPKQLTKSQEKEIKKEVNKQLKTSSKELKKVTKKLQKEEKIHKRLTRNLFKQSKHIRKHSSKIASKFRDHASTAIIAALSFLIAIAWKDLLVKFIKENVKVESLEKYPYLADLYTALIVTFIAVVMIILVANWVKKDSE